MNDGTGTGGCTRTVVEVVLEPPEFETVSRTVYEPSAANTWVGSAARDVTPSPKSQRHSVGDPRLVSVKVTTTSGVMTAGETENDAVGAGGRGVTSTDTEARDDPAEFVAVSVTA